MFTARSQHAEDLGKLRAHRQIQRLAGRQPAKKPLARSGALHCIRDTSRAANRLNQPLTRT